MLTNSPSKFLRRAAASFTPSQIAGLQLWLKADAITGLADADAIGTWADSSGNGRNATQAGAATLKPTYKAGIINSLPVARFDGGDWLGVATVTTLGINALTTGHTIIIVHKAAAASGNNAIASNYDDPVGTNVLAMATTTITNLRGGSASTHTATATQDTNWHIGTHWYSGGATKTFNGWRDGTPLTLNPVGGAFSDTGSFESGVTWRIGSWGDLAAYFAGDIAEVIIYDSALSDANRQAVEAYLSAKYGIALA